MANISLAPYITLVLLTIDGVIELAFITSMVTWLNGRAGGLFEIAYQNSSYELYRKPLHFLVNQGHTSNGAAGTAFILVGLGGGIVLFLRSRPNLWRYGFVKVLHHIWLVLTVLSALLTFAALVYIFAVTNSHNGQIINQGISSKLNTRPYPYQTAYPLDTWTPENWFSAVLSLNFVNSGDRGMIASRLNIMRGWRWNLIPMFIIGVVVTVLALLDALSWRKVMRGEKSTRPQTIAKP